MICILTYDLLNANTNCGGHMTFKVLRNRVTRPTGKTMLVKNITEMHDIVKLSISMQI